MHRHLVVAVPILLLAACGGGEDSSAPVNGTLPAGPETRSAMLPPDAIPDDVAALAERTVPGMIIDAIERKERDGRVYLDVEGRRADGSEVELDILQEGKAWRVVEIQRDIPWNAAPGSVQAAANIKADMFPPERVIESRLPDGSVIYELFAPGRPKEPAMEVQLKSGKASVLSERWPD